MIRKIKKLGFAFLATAAMGMTCIPCANAAEAHVTAPDEAVITGQQIAQHTIVTQAGGIGCTTVTYEGSIADTGGSETGQITEQEITLTPTISGCATFGAGTPVKMNGCKYTVTGATLNPVHTTSRTASIDIAGCTAGKAIEIVSGHSGCVTTVPQQANLSHVVFSNTQQGVSPHHVHADITIQNLSYELHGVFCPGGGATGPRQDGKYHGQATFRAYKKTGEHLTTEHGHQFSKQTHAEQVGLLAT